MGFEPETFWPAVQSINHYTTGANGNNYIFVKFVAFTCSNMFDEWLILFTYDTKPNKTWNLWTGHI